MTTATIELARERVRYGAGGGIYRIVATAVESNGLAAPAPAATAASLGITNGPPSGPYGGAAARPGGPSNWRGRHEPGDCRRGGSVRARET